MLKKAKEVIPGLPRVGMAVVGVLRVIGRSFEGLNVSQNMLLRTHSHGLLVYLCR
jgi:hypothetical protein